MPQHLVGLIHVGGYLPNLALMRLAAYHRQLGDQVVLLQPSQHDPGQQPDVVYISTIFTWRRAQVEELIARYRGTAEVYVGGSGWDLGLRLPSEIDRLAPDYSLYGIEYGMGYSSRGCIRHCAFCPVPVAEGHIREDAQLATLLNPASKRLMLLDNNFFASDWRPKIQEILGRGLVVDWPQGNDIRLISDDVAQALGTLLGRGQLSGDRFTRPNTLHFAWDLPSNDARREDVLRGIRHLFAAGFGPNDLRFFVLVGFAGYSLDEELERITTLHELGIEPYVMVYRDYGETDTRDPERRRLAKWNNGHAWRSVSWKEFDLTLIKR